MIQTSSLIRLIEAFKSGNTETANGLLKEIIKNAEKRKQYKVAKELRRVYSSPATSNGGSRNFSSSWAKEEFDENQKLFEVRTSKVGLKNIVLSEKNKIVFKEIETNYRKRELLRKHGLTNDSHILLYGPPGTGKTLFAYVLAGTLKIPIIHVYLDVLISSYLGETGKNLKRVFKEAMEGDCVLFLDEFDAIAKHRDDNQELGELKRVVTVLLQNIDELPSSTILVAATNHEHLLDPAIWRRFDYQINLDILDKKSRNDIFKLFLRKEDKVDLEALSSMSEGFSGAIIRQMINKSLRKKILEENNDIEELLVQEIMLRLSSIEKITKNEKSINLAEAIKFLRKKNKKKYTFDQLEKISGMPSSTIHHLVKQYDN